MNKTSKYDLFRRFPGEIGHRYQQKYMVSTNGFEKALHQSKGMTCIDLGANLGKFTRQMASKAKQVIAFEPDPWTYAALENNVADLQNVRLENLAVGVSEDLVYLYRHPRFDENPALYSEASSTIPDKINVTEDECVQVRQVDFTSYLEQLDDNIGVLKIDIEGAEVDLLEALFDRRDLLDRIRFLFAETHERRIPEHKPRVKALREFARRLEHPYVNLYWH